MSLSKAEIGQLCTIARAAGAAILERYERPAAIGTKHDNSPLTEADLKADEIIRDGLIKAFPGVGILSEESAWTAGDTVGTTFIVDPLDGTKEFLKRNGEFTVNIALHRGGSSPSGLVAGVIYAPALQQMFFGTPDLGAYAQYADAEPHRIAVSNHPHDVLRILASRSHGSAAVDRWTLALGSAHVIDCVGSSLKFCRIAEGAADLYPRFGSISQWDTAAGACVLSSAGGAVAGLDGQPLLYGPSEPMCHAGLIAAANAALLTLAQDAAAKAEVADTAATRA